MKPLMSQPNFSSDQYRSERPVDSGSRSGPLRNTDAESTHGCILQGQVQQNGMIVPLTLAAHPAK